MRWLVLLLLIPAATADVVISHSGDGPMTTAFAVRDDQGNILTHQNVELTLQTPGLNMTSATMHDHDAFFWMLSQPRASGPVEATVQAAAASGMSTSTFQLRDGPTRATWGEPGTALVLDGDGTAFYRIFIDDRLTAWGTRTLDGATELARLPAGADVDVVAHVMRGASSRVVATGFTVPSSDGPLPQLPAVLEDPEQTPAPCMDIRQEPEGDWYVDTHVRLSIDPGSRIEAPQTFAATYTLRGTDALAVTVDDPYGHAVLRAREAGAHTLTVAHPGGTCELAINVLASQGTIEPMWDVTAVDGGFKVHFDTASDAHYDVDGVITDQDGRLVYAGKIHSHSTGTSATFQVPPGRYDIEMYAVAQGAGPTVAPLATSMTVGDEPMPAEDAATPMPWFLVLAAILVARRPQRL